jgi:hypothetical protein
MSKGITSFGSRLHPRLWRWVSEFGTLEIGYCHQTRSFIRVLDEGGIVWKGRRSYPTLDTPRLMSAAHKVNGVTKIAAR